MEKDSCYGCHHTEVCFIKNQQEKGYPIKGRITNCPCSNCLIKPVCNNLCEDFILHYGKVFGLESMEALDVFYHS